MENEVYFDKSKIGKNVINAKYAVRGPIVQRAHQITSEIQKKKHHKYPFKKVQMFNVGNPQALGQIPMTFIRQVLASCLYPNLNDIGVFPSDVKERAKRILGPRNTIGSYTVSKGLKIVRDDVAKFLEKRDGVPSDSEKIFLTNGASQGISLLLSMLISSEKDGIMTPIPQYPLYSSNITLLGGKMVGYYLDESDTWSIKMKEMTRSLEKAKTQGVIPKAICVINPGNPTGQILTEETIRGIIRFARHNRLVILADEVYQKNIYTPKKRFVPFRKILGEMGKEYNSVCLCSFDSVSKGVLGECGLRGGYAEFFNFQPEVMAVYLKLVSMCLCSNISGQIAIDVSVNPPQKGDPSFEVYEKEYNSRLESLKRRSKIVTERLSKIEGIYCNEIEGSLYCFAKIILPEKAVSIAKEKGVEADEYYCSELLEATGMCVVPGSGFEQEEGTYHLRITILPQEEVFEEVFEAFEKFHIGFLKRFRP